MGTKRPDVAESVFDLAEKFLDDNVKGYVIDDVWNLAKVIQDACEDACREVEERSGTPESLQGS